MQVTTSRCLCDGSPHDTDTITFVDRPDFMRSVSMQKAVTILKADEPDATPEQVLAVLSQAYLRYGIDSWSLVGPDAKGKVGPLPVTVATVDDRLLSQVDVALDLVDAVDDLYAPVVLLPLLRRAVTSSPASPTTAGTSAPTGSPATSPTPSSPSSISTIPTADTATTSARRAGGSKSSPRPASVA